MSPRQTTGDATMEDTMQQPVGPKGFAVEPVRDERFMVRENPMGERAKKAHRWMVWDKATGKATDFAPSQGAAERKRDHRLWLMSN